MTIETLERAKDIQHQIEVIEDAIDGFKTSKELYFGYEEFSLNSMGSKFAGLPKRCQQPILELLKKELDVLKKELKDL